MLTVLTSILLAVAASGAANQEATRMTELNRTIEKEIVVAASLAEVWRAWTTSQGAREFLAPGSNIDLEIGGPYEILFFPDAPAGKRGGEGLKVLSFLPEEMISLDWSFPPSVPSLREADARTWVVIQLVEIDAGVRVRLVQLGWQEGEDWDRGFEYFQDAWGVVLSRLQRRFAEGPIDWQAEYSDR